FKEVDYVTKIDDITRYQLPQGTYYLVIQGEGGVEVVSSFYEDFGEDITYGTDLPVIQDYYKFTLDNTATIFIYDYFINFDLYHNLYDSNFELVGYPKFIP